MGPELDKRYTPHLRPTNGFYMDETYIEVAEPASKMEPLIQLATLWTFLANKPRDILPPQNAFPQTLKALHSKPTSYYCDDATEPERMNLKQKRSRLPK